MHILLTDILRCPHCGPEFGLILLADRMEERRVLSGTLGCPNCRRHYPIEAGIADLRLSEGPPMTIVPPEISDVEETSFRVAALLGAQQVNANILLLGPRSDIGARLAAIFPEAHIVLGSDTPPEGRAGEGGAEPWSGAPFRQPGQGPEEAEVPEVSAPSRSRQPAVSEEPAESQRPAAAEESVEKEEFSNTAGTLSRTLHGGRLPFATGAFAGVAVVGSPGPELLPELARMLRPGARLVVEGALAEVHQALRRLGFEIILNQDATVVAAVLKPR